MMDRPAIHAAEDFVHAGYPLECEALLIVELDGPAYRGRSPDRPRRGDRAEGTARPPAASRNPKQERLVFWAGRKAAFPGGRPHLARLLLHGRHHPAQGTAARACRHARAVGEIRAARRQRLPRRRRQSASADPLRRQQAGRAGQGREHSAPTSCGSASRSAAC